MSIFSGSTEYLFDQHPMDGQFPSGDGLFALTRPGPIGTAPHHRLVGLYEPSDGKASHLDWQQWKIIRSTDGIAWRLAQAQFRDAAAHRSAIAALKNAADHYVDVRFIKIPGQDPKPGAA